MAGDLIEVSLDMREVHEQSLGLLSCLEGIEMEIGIASLALTLARLMATERMEMKDEILATQNIMQFVGMLFVEGSVN
jgi:hypothetical protein